MFQRAVWVEEPPFLPVGLCIQTKCMRKERFLVCQNPLPAAMFGIPVFYNGRAKMQILELQKSNVTLYEEII